MNNSPAHLVARALRDHRTVTWSYYGTGTGYWRFNNTLTRSQILKDVRRTPNYLITYGLEYDGNRPTPNNGRYGLHAYAIIPEPSPAPRDHAAEMTALRVQRIRTDFAALSETDKRYILLQLQASLTAKNALN